MEDKPTAITCIYAPASCWAMGIETCDYCADNHPAMVLAERRIVEWLRGVDPMRTLGQDFIADAIERGEHRG